MSAEVHQSARNEVVSRWVPIPDTPFDVVEQWIGEGVLAGRAAAYLDRVLGDAARTLGSQTYMSWYEDPPTGLAEHVPPGSALDPAGSTAAIRDGRPSARPPCAVRARGHGSMARRAPAPAPAVDVLARRPLCRAVDAVRPGCRSRGSTRREPEGPLPPRRRRTRARQPARETAARAALPGVLVRGPDAVGRALRHDLWLADDERLDEALGFVEACEQSDAGAGRRTPVPMPRQVFSCTDAALRRALLSFGLAVWTDRAAGPRAISSLLDTIRAASGRPGAVPWAVLLPRLHVEGCSLLRRAHQRAQAAADDDEPETAALAFAGLDVCARWMEAGHSHVGSLARVLSRRWRSPDDAALEWDPDDEDHNRLIVALAEGQVPRLLALLRLPRAPRRRVWRGLDGFRAVGRQHAARAWVSACLDRTELAGRVVGLLEQIGLVLRLNPGMGPARLFAPLERGIESAAKWPTWVLPRDAAALTEILWSRTLAAATPDVPGSLRQILDRPVTLARELAVLQARAAARPLSPAERARADRLVQLAADPAALRADLRRALARALPKQRALAGLAALEVVVAGHLDRRWRGVLGGSAVPKGAAWDNALMMLESVSRNRRLLRQVLRHAVQGDHRWMLALEPNRAFLERVAAGGVLPDAWLAFRSRAVERAADVLTAYATTDPLEVLQMGSLFGTCLSADRFNAHAAVAAAVEVNKRVLYVKDRRGRVLGRQLLAMLTSGEIVGFTCYGAGLEDSRKTGTWVKVALEVTRARPGAGGWSPDSRPPPAWPRASAGPRSSRSSCSAKATSTRPSRSIGGIEALAADPAGDDRARVRSPARGVRSRDPRRPRGGGLGTPRARLGSRPRRAVARHRRPRARARAVPGPWARRRGRHLSRGAAPSRIWGRLSRVRVDVLPLIGQTPPHDVGQERNQQPLLDRPGIVDVRGGMVLARLIDGSPNLDLSVLVAPQQHRRHHDDRPRSSCDRPVDRLANSGTAELVVPGIDRAAQPEGSVAATAHRLPSCTGSFSTVRGHAATSSANRSRHRRSTPIRSTTLPPNSSIISRPTRRGG